MEKLKIGLFIDTWYPMIDGVIQVVDNLATNLHDLCDITVFTIRPADKNKKDTKEHNYKVVTCKSKGLFFLDYDMPTPRLDKKFMKTLKESKLDVVYLHSPMALGKCAINYAKKNNVPAISHLHSQYKADFYRATRSKILTNWLTRKIIKVFNQSDCAIPVNEFTEKMFIEDYGLKCPTRVIYNATNMLPIKNKKQAREEINKDYNLKDDEYVFTYVGRINKLKNLDLIFDSLLILKKRMDNFKFLVVGGGNDTDYFKKKVKDLGIEDSVIFTGKILETGKLEKIYSRADLLLFASFYDTDGLIKFEAASQGTPTVFVENSGPSSSIIQNETGFIAKNDPQDFADKIYLALTDKELYNTVCENVKTKLYRTWADKSANEVYELLKEFVNKNKSKKNIEK